MTFQEWVNSNPNFAALSAADLRFAELVWIAAKADAAAGRLDDMMQREAA